MTSLSKLHQQLARFALALLLIGAAPAVNAAAISYQLFFGFSFFPGPNGALEAGTVVPAPQNSDYQFRFDNGRLSIETLVDRELGGSLPFGFQFIALDGLSFGDLGTSFIDGCATPGRFLPSCGEIDGRPIGVWVPFLNLPTRIDMPASIEVIGLISEPASLLMLLTLLGLVAWATLRRAVFDPRKF